MEIKVIRYTEIVGTTISYKGSSGEVYTRKVDKSISDVQNYIKQAINNKEPILLNQTRYNTNRNYTALKDIKPEDDGYIARFVDDIHVYIRDINKLTIKESKRVMHIVPNAPKPLDLMEMISFLRENMNRMGVHRYELITEDRDTNTVTKKTKYVR